MSTTWEIDNKRSPRFGTARKGDQSPMDLFEIGMRSFSDTLEVIDRMMNRSVSKKSKCGCGCHHHECMDPMMDCYPCGPHRSDTDLKLEARIGERRILSILVENNLDTPSQVSLELATLMDACGNVIDAGQLVGFQPQTFIVPPCSCQRVRIGLNIQAPLQDGQVYYGDIHLRGDCCAKTVSLGIWIEADHCIDHHSLCDPCRPKKGKLVEFRSCQCGCCAPGKTYYLCAEQDSSTPPGTHAGH